MGGAAAAAAEDWLALVGAVFVAILTVGAPTLDEIFHPLKLLQGAQKWRRRSESGRTGV